MSAKSDVAVGVSLLAAGLITLLGVRGLPIVHKGTGFGPGALPVVVGIGSSLLGVAQLLVPLLSRRTDAGPRSENPRAQTKPLMVALATIGYVTLISWVGFLISSILFMFVTTRIFGERKYLVCAGYAGAFACLCYLLFSVWLKVVLPG